jgi:hypothetical protein
MVLVREALEVTVFRLKERELTVHSKAWKGAMIQSQVSQFDLFELKFMDSSFSSLSFRRMYTNGSPSSGSRQQHLSQQHPPPVSRPQRALMQHSPGWRSSHCCFVQRNTYVHVAGPQKGTRKSGSPKGDLMVGSPVAALCSRPVWLLSPAMIHMHC